MELLVDKTENLNQQAFQFKKKSTQLKRAMWWQNTKLMVILAFVVLVSFFFSFHLFIIYPNFKKFL